VQSWDSKPRQKGLTDWPNFGCSLTVIPQSVWWLAGRMRGRDSNSGTCKIFFDRLCGLVVSVPCYRYRGPGFDSRRYQILWEVVGLERGPLSLVRIIEELFQGNSGSGIENRNWRQDERRKGQTRNSPRHAFILFIVKNVFPHVRIGWFVIKAKVYVKYSIREDQCYVI
jgi:hypothetical protein